ncbi:MAG TPA: molybdopterin-dependent oxidoreductase [Candidatus Nitrosocosmicus sp.]|nr:molybdopterin-dependent oxidoreductase [Candidatus Nitrosocosmicus sp.]
MVQKAKTNLYLVFFIFGLVAGISCTVLGIFLRINYDGIFLPQLAAQGLISNTSGEIESQAVLTLGPLAKYSTFIGATFVNILIYGVFGILLGKFFQRIKQSNLGIRFILSTLIPYIFMLAIAVILLIISTTPGQSILYPTVKSIALFLLPHMIFGLVFVLLLGNKGRRGVVSQLQSKEYDLTPPDKKPTPTIPIRDTDYNKRDMIKALLISVVAIPLIYLGFNRLISGSEQKTQPSASSSSNTVIRQILQSKSKPAGFENPLLTPLVDAEITPTYLFYRIDINTVVPNVDVTTWSLTLKGLVDTPMTFNYDQIKKMESVEQFATLACISNKLGGNLISTALWKGVRLKDLLVKTGVKPNVKYIVFRCSDGYDVGIPIESGMLDGTILAYDMNKSPLTSEHGYPLRAIVPGFYGMMNPKWILEIELVDKTYEGFWQRKGWTNNGIGAINSTIVFPGNQPIDDRFPHSVTSNAFPPGKNIPIAGIAFAGDRGIAKVEVSVDGGKTWKTAVVKDPLSQYTWVLWTTGFVAPDKGSYEIVVRATDKTGEVQTSTLVDPYPNGAQGYNRVDLIV